jgi:hypothetical protein
LWWSRRATIVWWLDWRIRRYWDSEIQWLLSMQVLFQFQSDDFDDFREWNPFYFIDLLSAMNASVSWGSVGITSQQELRFV